MKTFDSLAVCSEFLQGLGDTVEKALEQSLEKVATELQEAVKASLEAEPGRHGAAVPPESIGHECEGLEAAIGSTSATALLRELGSPQKAPDPFMADALERTDEERKKMVGEAVFETLCGG